MESSSTQRKARAGYRHLISSTSFLVIGRADATPFIAGVGKESKAQLMGHLLRLVAHIADAIFRYCRKSFAWPASFSVAPPLSKAFYDIPPAGRSLMLYMLGFERSSWPLGERPPVSSTKNVVACLRRLPAQYCRRRRWPADFRSGQVVHRYGGICADLGARSLTTTTDRRSYVSQKSRAIQKGGGRRTTKSGSSVSTVHHTIASIA